MKDIYYIIIIGCGRLGGILANTLSLEGHQIVVIDKRERAFDKLSSDFSGFRIIGDATELSILQEAQIERADFVLAATTEDNVNLMVAQVARKIFGVPRVLARIYDTAREMIYREFDIETISPTHLTADAFLDALRS